MTVTYWILTLDPGEIIICRHLMHRLLLIYEITGLYSLNAVYHSLTVTDASLTQNYQTFDLNRGKIMTATYALLADKARESRNFLLK